MNRESAIELLVRLCAEVQGSYPAPPAAIVVAHPDDECLGAGSRLPWLRRAAFVHVTDGAPRDLRDATAAGFATRHDYTLERRCELKRALALAGIVPNQTLELGYADQEGSLHLAELAQVLAKIFRALQPQMVLTHPYEGGHPDHDATAFGVQAACRLLAAQQFPAPVVIEMTSYHSREGAMAVGEFLPHAGHEVIARVLSEPERQLKQRMLDCFATQQKTLRAFPVDVERFRLAPRYDFTQPPHAGPLFYEQFEWGMTGARWRELAKGALRALEGARKPECKLTNE